MGKLTWTEIVGLSDEVIKAVAAVKEVVDTARQAASGDSPAGKSLGKKEVQKIEATGDKAVAAIKHLVDTILEEATD